MNCLTSVSSNLILLTVWALCRLLTWSHELFDFINCPNLIPLTVWALCQLLSLLVNCLSSASYRLGRNIFYSFRLLVIFSIINIKLSLIISMWLSETKIGKSPKINYVEKFPYNILRDQIWVQGFWNMGPRYTMAGLKRQLLGNQIYNPKRCMHT